MTAVDDILGALPVERVTQQTGSPPTRCARPPPPSSPRCSAGSRPTPVTTRGGGAPPGPRSADPDLLAGGADLGQIDEQDGKVIASHVFERPSRTR